MERSFVDPSNAEVTPCGSVPASIIREFIPAEFALVLR
jgi:hypothetical protein